MQAIALLESQHRLKLKSELHGKQLTHNTHQCKLLGRNKISTVELFTLKGAHL